MTAILKVDTIQDTAGNNIINESSDTITIGASGDTISIPSGATIANSGTATGFGIDGITVADQWRLTTTTNDGTNADITSNWERVDTAGAGFIGSAMAESSGVFTFPSTGMYLVATSWYIIASSDGSATIRTQVTQNNSSYVDASIANAHSSGNSTCPSNYIVDVTDTSNVKVKFRTTSFASGTSIYGETSITYTGVWFIRLGDT